MGINNLGNNQFGKLAAQNYAKAKVQQNSVDVTNNQIKKETTKNVNLNKGTLQAGQADLSANLFASIERDIDDINGGEINGGNGQIDKADKPKPNSGGSTSGGSSGHQHTELEESMLREMQENAVKDDAWAAGAALVYLGSRLYHWIKGD